MLTVKESDFGLSAIEEKVPVHLVSNIYKESRIAKVWLLDDEKQLFACTYGTWDNDSQSLDIQYKTRYEMEMAIKQFLFGYVVEIGLDFDEYINQAFRVCTVISLPKTSKGASFRIGFEMPNCNQQGTRKAFRFYDKLYYNPPTE
jgi:hypothetical protein